MIKHLLIAAAFIIQGLCTIICAQEPTLTIIIPSYNNELFYERNLDSIRAQDYALYRILYIDDNSEDNTLKYVQHYSAHHKNLSIEIRHNTTHKGTLATLYDSIHNCDDPEIIIILDGRDWLAHDHVLSAIVKRFINTDIWCASGNYTTHPDYLQSPGGQWPILISCCWLLKAINRADLMYKNIFYPAAWNKALRDPMIELAGATHSTYITDILYVRMNQRNYGSAAIDLDQAFTRILAARKPYKELKEAYRNHSASA